MVRTVWAEEGGNPLILPEPTEASPLRFTSLTSGEIVLSNLGLTIVCKSGTSSGKFTSKRSGTATLSFNTCISLALTHCHTAGSTEIVFANASIHLVAYKHFEELRAGVVFKLATTTLLILCEGETFEWRGSVVGEYEKIPNGQPIKAAELVFLNEGERQAVRECELSKELCFEGSSHKIFVLEVFNGVTFKEMYMKRIEEVVFEKEASFNF